MEEPLRLAHLGCSFEPGGHLEVLAVVFVLVDGLVVEGQAED